MVTFMILVVSGICVFSFLIAFCIMCTLALTKKRCSEDVIAELVGLNMHPSKKIYGYHPSEGTVYPVYKYKYKGEWIYKFSDYDNLKHKFSIGELKNIKINPDNPYEIYYPGTEVSSFIRLLLTIGLMGILILVLLYKLV